MYFRNMKNYNSMNIVYTTPEGNELWLGDYYAATDLGLLKQKKISSVLTAAAMLGVNYPKDAAINHKVVNAFDIPTYKMTPHFQESYQFIRDALERGNILVHCAAGISRSTTFVLVYLMREKGYGLQQAIGIVRSRRPIINPNYGFLAELSKYQQVLKKGTMKNPSDKNQKTNGFLDKPEKTAKQIQEQKAAFVNFVKRQSNMSKTTGSYIQGTRFKSIAGKREQPQETQPKPKNDQIQRGMSVNSKKIVNVDSLFPSSRINNLTFKLEQPKIVTIKR